MVNKVNPEGWLAWVLERIEDHPANRINDLMPWAFQDVINAQRIRSRYEAVLLAEFIQEAADFYHKRGLFRKRY
jgi:hypothetical protein